MRPKENLHYAIGQLAYAIAKADGKIQKEERQKFAEIVKSELQKHDYDFNISDIIFQILDKEKFVQTEDAYDWAMKEIRLNSHYLSPELKKNFIKIMEKIAKAYSPVTMAETDLLKKFKSDIEPIIGDPVYYKSNINMETSINIDNLKCAGCASTIEETLLKIKGIDKVSVLVNEGRVIIYHSVAINVPAVKSKLRKIGYPEKGTAHGLEKLGTTAKSYISCAIGRIGKKEKVK